jgi:hypothetical protein
MNEHDAPAGAPPDRPPPDGAAADEPTDAQLAELVRAGAAAEVPAGVRAAVAGADRPDAGPGPGEVWRARRSAGGLGTGPLALVWLRSVSLSGARAVPVSFDTDRPDDETVVVAGDQSPFALPLAVHLGAETALDRAALVDRLGWLDPAAVEDAAEDAAARRRREEEEFDAARSPHRDVAATASIEDGGEWWPLPSPSARAELLQALHRSLGESHPGARIAPRPAASAGSQPLSAVALVAELDAFVLVAVLEQPLDDAARLEAARELLQADQLLNAVCLVEPAHPYLAVVVDRRDVVAAIETPSGELRPPRQTRAPAPIGTALSKFLDSTISPFGRLARTFVEGRALDPSALAADGSADAVRTVEGSARTFKTEGKRPGYERVTRHEASITRLVEEALNQADVDVAAILEDGER